jgi:SAM-dependent methyltransferase
MNALERRERLLRQINGRLPPGIDWKEGAATYLGNLIKTRGEHNERYHLIKPFIGGSNFEPFTSEMYRFVNMVARLPLNERSRILDIGCGPGWVSHYFAKLGLEVLGIDISQELLDIAERRLKGDLYPPYGPHWSARFALHDIEAAPLVGEKPFDVAIFESVLHHFHDPVAALDNTAAGLSEDGLVVIIEAQAPAPGTPYDLENQALMRDYHTIERPYTRAELDEMLDITGFGWRKYYFPINGWFEQNNEQATELFHLARSGPGYNLAIAARSQRRYDEVFGRQRPESTLRHIARRLSYTIGRRFLNLYRRLGQP